MVANKCMGESLTIRPLARCAGAQVLYVDVGGATAPEAIEPALAICAFSSGAVAVVPASVKCVDIAPAEPTARFGLIIESRALAHVAATAGVAVPPLDARYQDGIPDATIASLIEALQHELAAGGLATAMYIDALIAQLMVRVMRAFASASELPARTVTPLAPRPPEDARLARAIQYIEQHLTRPIGVEDIARAVDLSPFHFSRAFKRWTGESPHRFVLRQRLARAQRLVLESAMPLAQVATAVGFYDQSHLGHHYKREFGATPHEARARKNVRSR